MHRNQTLAALLLAAALVAAPAAAQLQTGNLYGTTLDEQGGALVGVTLTLTGAGAPQLQVSDDQGRFRFLGLSPGSYRLTATLDGFSTVELQSVVINVARNTQLEVTLGPAVEETITVTAESPLLDERRIGTGATVNQTELEKIPTARDPWAVLQSTPGVLTDRINVGGNESGQQSQYVGPGSSGDQAVWSVDGVVITDMAALGSSPAYYDFDSFEEMQVTTGGSDTAVATGGVVLNMVTKRGTNELRGSARYLLADESWQSDLNFDEGNLARAFPGNSGPSAPSGRAQPAFSQGNRIVSVEDYGFELGGPVVRDHLWVWGSYGLQEVDLLTISDVSDFTELETMNLKVNAQITANNSATAFALSSDKVKIGRNAGPFRPQPTTWNQSKFGDDPTAAKVEDTHVFSSNFYLTGLYSIVNGGFQLVPQGGIGNDITTALDGALVWHNTFQLYQTERPQEQAKLDGSTFFNTGALSHELRFGASYRNAEVASLSRWPGLGYYLDDTWGIFGANGDQGLMYLARDGFPATEQTYTSAFAQDTLTTGSLTINAGLRYDLQESKNLARTVRANPFFPDLLPEYRFAGSDAGFDWESITPRLGLTYALGADRQTLLRASYSRFADQLGTAAASWLNPINLYQYIYTYSTVGTPRDGRNLGRGNVDDLDGDGQITIDDFLGFSPNYNPHTGGALLSNQVDPSLDPQMTDELLFSVEHALRPEFVVGLNFTFRRITDILEQDLLVFDSSNPFSLANINSLGRRATRNDFAPCRNPVSGCPGTNARPDGLPNGDDYVFTWYGLRPGVSTRGGQYLFNGDREQEYMGTSLVLNKRLANRWMLRGNFTWADWEWSKIPESSIEDPTFILGQGNREGEAVLQGSGTGSGSKGGVYINSRWSYSVNALYQFAPDRAWGFNAALNLTGREGYPLPYFERLNSGVRGIPGFTRVQVVEDPTEFRLDDIHIVDARLEKELTFAELGVTLGLDVFNVFNEGYVLQRQHRLRQNPDPRLIAGNPFTPFGNYVTEITSPRIFRLGARISLR